MPFHSNSINFFGHSTQESFSAPMERSAFPRLRCVTESRNVKTSLTNLPAGNEPRAASTVVVTASVASQKHFCVMERETAWMAQMKWTVVGSDKSFSNNFHLVNYCITSSSLKFESLYV